MDGTYIGRMAFYVEQNPVPMKRAKHTEENTRLVNANRQMTEERKGHHRDTRRTTALNPVSEYYLEEDEELNEEESYEPVEIDEEELDEDLEADEATATRARGRQVTTKPRATGTKSIQRKRGSSANGHKTYKSISVRGRTTTAKNGSRKKSAETLAEAKRSKRDVRNVKARASRTRSTR